MIDVSSIGVIGSGGWGTALSVLLSKSGHSVTLWSYLKEEYENLSKDYENKALLPGVMIPKDVQFTTNLEFCVSQKDILVLAVPSNAVKSTAKNIAPFITEGQIIVIVSKGFDTDTNMLLTDTVLSEIPSAKVAVLSGPTHAEEVGVGMPTTIVVAHEDHKIA
ncbi:MAG: NAD(P)-binding domain-containing protein, partial [Clostridia bacterium]|nr:NAD(P)-binding domain-containing protein [Clostridia bacterium]